MLTGICAPMDMESCSNLGNDGGEAGDPPSCEWDSATGQCVIGATIGRMLGMMIEWAEAPEDSLCTEGDMMFMLTMQDPDGDGYHEQVMAGEIRYELFKTYGSRFTLVLAY